MASQISAIGFEKRLEISFFVPGVFADPAGNELSQLDEILKPSLFPKLNMYKLGARKIGVTSLPPLGCLPAAIALFGDLGSSQCAPRLNRDAVAFNNKRNSTVIALQSFHGNYFMVNRDDVAFMENAKSAFRAHSSSVKASGLVKVPNQNVPRLRNIKLLSKKKF